MARRLAGTIVVLIALAASGCWATDCGEHAGTSPAFQMSTFTCALATESTAAFYVHSFPCSGSTSSSSAMGMNTFDCAGSDSASAAFYAHSFPCSGSSSSSSAMGMNTFDCAGSSSETGNLTLMTFPCEASSEASLAFPFNSFECAGAATASDAFAMNSFPCEASIESSAIFQLNTFGCMVASADSESFAVLTFDCSGANAASSAFALDTRLSEPVSLSEAKAALEGDIVRTAGNSVTAIFDQFFYIEDPKRASGMRIDWLGTPPGLWRMVDVTGTARTDASGERHLDAGSVATGDLFPLDPIVMLLRSVGGGDFSYLPGPPPAGQQGITGAADLNNIGLLVTTCGTIVARDTANPATWFVINDGSAVSVKCLVPAGVTIDPNWVYLRVTGISSCEKSGGDLLPLIRVRDADDITVYLPPP